MRVLGFGDNIVDRFVDRGVEYPGGNCVNVAVYARQLGAEAAYLGVFGDDDAGVFVRGCIEGAGVDTARCEVRTGPNGLTEIETVHGDRRFLRWNGGGVTVSDPIRLRGLDYAGSFDLVHSSVYSAVESELPALRATKALVSFDFSSEAEYRSEAYLALVCPAIDLALVSCGGLEQQQVWSELRRFAAHGTPLVLGTMGEQGAVLFDGENFYHSNAAPAAAPFVDTMGCGDAYLAALAVGLLDAHWSRSALPPGTVIHAAMKRAARFAAGQCSVDGAFGFGRDVVPQPAV
jgi:fructoselysine 6-kinase